MAKDILHEIMSYKRQEVELKKAACALDVLKEKVNIAGLCAKPSMCRALTRSNFGIIAEFKRRSPSKGWINENASSLEIPLDYQNNGAAAISILTDSRFFAGEDTFVVNARSSGVSVPILYKNFVMDEYQLYEACLCGASAVLLIAACLSIEKCKVLNAIAHRLGMETLLEIHSEEELRYVDVLPDMVGVNNRNLGTFVTDVENSFRLADKLPNGVCKVSESGISSPATVAQLVKAGFNGFLIGETFMKEASPDAALGDFINDVRCSLAV